MCILDKSLRPRSLQQGYFATGEASAEWDSRGIRLACLRLGISSFTITGHRRVSSRFLNAFLTLCASLCSSFSFPSLPSACFDFNRARHSRLSARLWFASSVLQIVYASNARSATPNFWYRVDSVTYVLVQLGSWLLSRLRSACLQLCLGMRA